MNEEGIGNLDMKEGLREKKFAAEGLNENTLERDLNHCTI